MIAYKPFSLCPPDQRPEDVTLETPWQELAIDPSELAKYISEGWRIRTETSDRSTWAADLDNSDLVVTGNEWTKIIPNRTLWQNDDGLLVDGVFTVKKTGVYNFDVQLKVKNFENLTSVELALYQVVSGGPDDYWFIIAKRFIHEGETEVQLSNETQFDFRKGEQYYLAIQLEGDSPSLTMEGSDDYSAWGSSFVTELV